MSTPRVVRTATIQLGLVTVPVKLYTSSETADEIKFNRLHDADGARLKEQHICTACDEIVDKEHTVKGYEVSKDHYVTFTEAEIEALDALATNTIRVEEFVTLAAVDPLYVEKTYYLGPDKGAEVAYQLLVDAMLETKRVAIAQYARGGREVVAMVRPFCSELLALHELRYASEVRPATGIETGDASVAPALLKVAKQIISEMASDEFVPERYVDTVQQRKHELIKKKIDGGEIVVAPTSPAAAITDLHQALKASVDVAKTNNTRKLALKRDRKARAAQKRKAS